MSCSAAALTQLSVILAMWSGAVLVWWWVVVEPAAEELEVLGAVAGVRLLAPVTASATMLLALLGATVARYPHSKGGLLTVLFGVGFLSIGEGYDFYSKEGKSYPFLYGICSVLYVVLYCGSLAWGGVMTARWLEADPAMTELHKRAQLRAALLPLLALLAPDLNGQFQEEEVSVTSWVAWGMGVAWPFLQLLGAVLAACARNERHQLRSASSRSNSVYYEQSPAQLNKPPLPRGSFEDHAFWQ